MQHYIRWAFFYPKTHKFGVWSQASPHESDKACNQPMQDLVRAEIHAKPYGGSTETQRVYVCSGDEFHEFKWIGQVREKMGFSGTVPPEIVGIILVKKNGKRITFYKDGTLLEEG